MILEITWWSLILLLGTFQALFLCLTFIFQQHGRGPSRIILSILLLTFAIILFDHSLRLSNLYKSFPYGLYISDALWYLIAPLIWLYLRSRIGHDFKWRDLLHFIPFLVFAFIYRHLPFADVNLKIKMLENYLANGSIYSGIVKVFILIMMGQMLIYLVAGYFLLVNYHKLFVQQSSGNEIQYLITLKRLILFFSVYFLFEFSYSSYKNYYDLANKFIENWSLVMWTLFIISIAWVSVGNPKYFFVGIKPLKNKYEGLDLHKLKLRLIDCMNEKTPFLDSNLTLTQLANSINLNPHQLSFLLNSSMNTSFYDLVNVYRVRHVEKALRAREGEQYSIFGIAQNSGFKSKASFYSFFKKEFGVTPKKYVTRLKNGSNL